MNYVEHNRNTLTDALSQLPLHQPPEEVWGRIRSELSQKRKEQALQDAVKQLPAYSPPPVVWDAIESGLEQNKRTLRLRRIVWMSAASVAALVALALFVFTGAPRVQPAYTYDTEKASLGLFANNWDSDEEALQAVVEQFAQDPIAKNQSQYDRILEDWQELEEAKAEIKEIMELYGKDARLVRQMSEIERERSKLVKAMAMAI